MDLILTSVFKKFILLLYIRPLALIPVYLLGGCQGADTNKQVIA